MKLTVLSGLPCSGKTTFSEKIVKETGNTVRLNRDLLRTMLHFNKWSGKHEDLTVGAETALAQYFLSQCNVIIDDCNLNPKNIEKWKALASVTPGVKFEHIKINTPIGECILRSNKRTDGTYWDDVINNMALQYGLAPKPKKGYILCDIDGTLADITHRLQYAKGETKDWNKFFSLISEDYLKLETVDILLKYEEEGYDIILVSARPDTYRKETRIWLEKVMNGYPLWKTLIMRKGNDKRQDVEVKKQILDTYFPDKSLIHKIIDDRPSVIRMWKENGLDVINVGDGIEF